MSTYLKVEICFNCNSALHVAGERIELWTDKALVLDWIDMKRKIPIIPATSIKGWLRKNVERALRGLGVRICDASSNTFECPVCRVFGHPRMRSPLRFRDVKLIDSLTDVRTSVSLSRYRRTAYEDRLFSQEVAWVPKFKTHVLGIFQEEEDARIAAALLWLGAQMGFGLGGGRTRGLGWVELKDFTAQIDGKKMEQGELHSILESRIKLWKDNGGQRYG